MRSLPIGATFVLFAACMSCGESKDAGPSTGGTTASGGTTSSGGTTASGGASGDAAIDGAPAGGSGGSVDAAVDAAPVACPSFEEGVKTGAVSFAGVTEASGVVESRKNPGVLWVNNDSGDGPELYALGKDGKHLGVFTLQGATAVDWEDIAVGPGPSAGESYLYVGDIGDNAAARPNVVVYRVAEPDVSPAGPATNVTLSGVEKFTLTYPDGARNSESLLVDPKSSEVFVLTKASSGVSPLFRAPVPLAGGALTEVASVTFGTSTLPGSPLTTAADVSPSGDAIVVRTYSSAFLWRRSPGQSVAQALGGEPCVVPVAAEPQGEAIGFAADGSGYFTVSEGSNPPLWFFAKKP